jgi:nuclear transport factor 2 (NTF2) superfamily protein
MSTAANQATLANWMRVQINIRNGRDPQTSAIAAAKLTPWHTIGPAMTRDTLTVFAVDFLPDGWAYVDAAKMRIAYARDSYFTLAHDPDSLRISIARFLQNERPGLFRVTLTPAAVKAERDFEGTDQPDRLEQLDLDYRALLARLREARENDDVRALGEGLKVVRELAERKDALFAELERLSGYGETVKAMVRKLA